MSTDTPRATCSASPNWPTSSWHLVAAHRLPAVFPWRNYVELGGLMFYAPSGSQSEFHHRSAKYVDRILRGAKPADTPVEQPVNFDLVINLKTAEEQEFAMPSALLVQATDVVR